MDIHAVSLDDLSDEGRLRWTQYWQVRNADARARSGPDSTWFDPEQRRAVIATLPHTDRWFVGTVDGEPVANASLHVDAEDNTDQAQLSIRVLPAHEHQGHGRALVTPLLDEARRLGLTRALVEIVSKPGDGDLERRVRFAEHLGLSVRQELQFNLLTLPLSSEAAAAAESARTAAEQAGYVVEIVDDIPPESWWEGLARLHTRMSTDAPRDGLDLEDQLWTAERVRREYHVERDNAIAMSTGVVRHVDSGELVAYTTFQRFAEAGTRAHQIDTLVLREHRGRSLGMALKGAVLAHLAAQGAQSTLTCNAVSNARMRAVNAKLGYALYSELRFLQGPIPRA